MFFMQKNKTVYLKAHEKNTFKIYGFYNVNYYTNNKNYIYLNGKKNWITFFFLLK